MSTPKHTPGPWAVNDIDTGMSDDGTIINLHGMVIVSSVYGQTTEIAAANAALIAAAPAIYEALQQSLVLVELAALEEWGRAVRGEQQPPTTEAKDRLEKVKAALAQAEGK